MTLQAAWDLFASEGQRWRKGAVIIQLASSNLSADSPTAGDDGRRAGWLGVLAAPDGSATLRLHSMGTVIDSREQGPATQPPNPLPRPVIDSPRALASALAATPDLLATQEKSRGYHFVLKPGSPSVIGVIGAVQGAPSTVEIDAQAGGVAARSAYGPDATGGIIYSADAGLTWQASNLTGQMVSAAVADPRQPRGAWATVASGQSVAITHTTDGGRTWTRAGDLPSAAGGWAYGIAAGASGDASVLAVGTAQGVWVSRDGAITWTNGGGLPAGPAQFLAFASSSGQSVLHVTVSAGPNAGHYRSTDLQTQERAGEAGRLSQLDNGMSIVAVHEPSTPATAPLVGATLRSYLSRRETGRPPKLATALLG